MLTKFLLTLSVIIIAALYIRARHRAAQTPSGTAPDAAGAPSALTTPRLAAYLFIGLTAASAVLLTIQRWQDNNQLLTVKLYRTGAEQPLLFHVYKAQFKQRSFVTVDGVHVQVADNERIEVAGLDD